MKNLKKDKLDIRIYDTRKEMGTAAAADIETAVCEILKTKDCCNMIFAAAPSQNEVLEALAASEKIDWSRVNAYHMDEYIGLAQDAPQGFANFLRRGLFDKVPFASVNCLDSTNEPNAECERYGALLSANPTDIVCMGIGENGHIAFNEPDEHLSAGTHVISLTENTIEANARFFDNIDDVPRTAITMGVGGIMKAKKIILIASGESKAEAIKGLFSGKITTENPASMLQMHRDVTVIVDKEAAKLIEN